MTTINNDYGAVFSREEFERAIDECWKVIDSMRAGNVPTPNNPCWRDPRFHKCLTSALQNVEQVREDARKLAVIKEVFGGVKA